MKIKRIYHHIDKLEELPNGMWNIVPKEQEESLLKKAIEFTGNHKLYGKCMMEIVEKWKYSCEHNLSYRGLNRQAWIGHAACCIGIQCPEYIVRQAWHYLTEEQQILANKEADKAILEWENKHRMELMKRDKANA